MRRLLAWVGAFTIAVTAGITGAPSALARSPESPGDAISPLILVLDTSGSMAGDRLAQAKSAALTFIDNAAIHENVGLFTYPGGVPRDGCRPGAFHIEPWAGASPDDVRVAVASLSAGSNTPTGPALESILDYLVERNIQSGRVVLISDGEANCGNNDICSYADLFQQRGVNLEVSTVSFDNSVAGDAQLACLAESTGGTYTDAQNWEEAARALRDNQSFRADLDVSAPARLTGSLTTEEARISVTVTSTGRQEIPRAKLVVSVVSVDGSTDQRRRVWVERPVRQLGNLAAPGGNETALSHRTTFMLRPQIEADGEFEWTVTLLADNVPISTETGTIAALTHAEAGPLFTQAERVAILGDSYSSGEGAGPYLGLDVDADTTLSRCHRSEHAYGKLIFPGAVMVACSGALTEHLWQPQITKKGTAGGSMDAQLVALHRDIRENGAPDLVLLTLGGNDAGFANQVTACVTGKCREVDFGEWGVLSHRLIDSYEQINAVINNPAVVAQRNGKIAQIVVLPYVDPIPGVPDAQNWCFDLIDRSELQILKSFAKRLNESVTNAVIEAQARGLPIQLADPVEQALQPNHHMCAEDPWIVADYAILRSFYSPDLQQELAHPNRKGQGAIAETLIEWSRTAEPVAMTIEPSIEGIRVIRLLNNGHVALQTLDQSTEYSFQAIRVLEPGIHFDPNKICRVRCEWGNYPVRAVLNSLPVPLGSYYADEDGELPLIPIPLNTPPGKHTFTLTSFDANGEEVVVEIPIRVWPEGTSRALNLGALGGALLLAAGVLYLIGRIRARNG